MVTFACFFLPWFPTKFSSSPFLFLFVYYSSFFFFSKFTFPSTNKSEIVLGFNQVAPEAFNFVSNKLQGHFFFTEHWNSMPLITKVGWILSSFSKSLTIFSKTQNILLNLWDRMQKLQALPDPIFNDLKVNIDVHEVKNVDAKNRRRMKIFPIELFTKFVNFDI